MKRFVGFSGAVAIAICGLAFWAQAAPEPKFIPTEWELDVTFQKPQPIRVNVPGESGPQTFWYVLYSVTNNGDTDQVFVPRVALYTDTGQVRYGSEGIYPAVFAAIQDRHNSPYLKDLANITGKILTGADNAKDGVAIFRDFDPDAREIDIFIGGLSGETAVVKLPTKVAIEETDIRGKTTTVMRDRIILHKTLHLSYKIPGEQAARYSTPATLAAEAWIMR